MEHFNPNINKQSETNPLEKRSSFERVKEKAAKFMKRVRQVAFVLVLAGVTDYQLTHHNKIESTNIDGKEIFKHSDEETTHILNYLGGVDSITRDEQAEFLKGLYIGFDKLPIPANIDEMQGEELINYIAEAMANSEYNPAKESAEKMKLDIEEMFKRSLPIKYEYNDTVYKQLWQAEQECGSPKIDWTYGNDRHFLELNSKNNKVAHYNEFTHTVFIKPIGYRSINSLIAEWSHAKQFHDNPVGSNLQAIEDGIRIANNVIKSEHKDYTISQLLEYSIPGSIEHDAHEIIEPYLKEKYPNIKNLKPKEGEK